MAGRGWKDPRGWRVGLTDPAARAAVQMHTWFPEGLTYESPERWQSPELEKLLIGLVQVGLLH